MTMSTQNDRDVLNSILNPNLPLGEGVFDPDHRPPPSSAEASFNDENVKKLENDGVRAAEEGDIDKALELFNEVLRHELGTSLQDHSRWWSWPP